MCEDDVSAKSAFKHQHFTGCALSLNEYLKLGHGEEERGGKYRKAIVADIFESFIGAMYLDLGFEEVKKFIYKHVIPLIEDKSIDFLNIKML